MLDPNEGYWAAPGPMQSLLPSFIVSAVKTYPEAFVLVRITRFSGKSACYGKMILIPKN